MSTPSQRPYRDFGAWLRSRRLARRWTQEELARRLGYDVSYVRKVEWGERRPSDALKVRLAQVLGVPVSGLPSAVPPTPPRPLPETATPLVDREEALGALVALFDTGSRLVTITGGPGIGKTRLALAVATHYDARLAGGARFVPLTSVAGAGGVASAVADALGTARPAGDHQLGRLADGLRDLEVLLVLDNFEHVVEAAPMVAELLAGLPSLRVLATSRQALELRAETQYALAPLRLPDAPTETPERLAGVPSVALFVARARKVAPSFALDRANAAEVAEICARVQGIPLAIEMAAGAMRFLTPKALLDQLGHGLDLPVTGPRDAPQHHRTLRAAISWSYELLGPHQKTLLSRLAVFAEGCLLAAADAVCRSPEDSFLDARMGLLGLAAKSLVDPVKGDAGSTRFVMLETVRAFALEQLTAAGDLQRFQARHAAWCLELAESSEQGLTGPEQTATLAALEAEHANLRAAIRWSLGNDPAVATRLCAALWRFWWIRGYLTEGRRWLGEALATAHDDLGARSRALIGAGVLARTQGAYEAAVAFLDEGRGLAQALGDRSALALSLINLGIVAEHRAAGHRAMALFEEARRLYEEIDDRRGVGHTLNCLGTSRLGQGDLGGAAALFEQALSTFRAVGDHWSAAMALANLGWLAQKQGRRPLARSRYEKGLAMYRALGDDLGAATMLLNLGLVVNDAGEGDDVHGLFAEALLAFVRSGERRGVAECLEALALVGRREDPARAAVLLGTADALRDAIGAPLAAGDQVAHDDLLGALWSDLGEGPFNVAWHRGRLLELEEVVALALADVERVGAPHA